MAFLFVNEIEDEEKFFNEIINLGVTLPMYDFKPNVKYALAILSFSNVADFTRVKDDLDEFPIVSEEWFRNRVLNSSDPKKEFVRLTKIIKDTTFQCLSDYASYTCHKNKKDGVTNN